MGDEVRIAVFIVAYGRLLMTHSEFLESAGGPEEAHMTSLISAVTTVRDHEAMPDKSYRCYFTDAGDRIRSYEQITSRDDASAVLKAEELLAASKYGSAELWQGKRLVGKWTTSGWDRANGTGKAE